MAERTFQIVNNGTQVVIEDLNLLGEESGLADDHVLAELLRLTPYNGSAVSKAILSYGHATSAGTDALIMPNGATGQVKVNPFRAIVGSRTAVATDAKANWRDIRSAICVGTTTLHQAVTIAANATGNPRWDLLYAVVTVDANGASETRKVKDPTTRIIADQTVVTYKQTTVTLAVAAGTAAASPTWPSIPADAGSVYNIPLAYVRVPNGFNASSTVGKSDIAEVAPVVTHNSGTGGRFTVADTLYTPGTPGFTAALAQSWGASGTRPAVFVAPTMGGAMETLLVFVDLTTGSESHANGAVVDSRDWRNRLCNWTAAINNSSPAWHRGGGGVSVFPRNNANSSAHPGPYSSVSAGSRIQMGLGNSFRTAAGSGAIPLTDDQGSTSGAGVAIVQGVETALGDTSYIQLFCRTSDGALCVNYANAPDNRAMFWLMFTPAFGNY